ncbi:MAG: DUF134 domain-containing protein [Bacteroidia bacterium]|nr:DUF134 domain-containing protein [Bacteroidia bacterium]
MARPKRLRKIAGIPTVSGFTPYGHSGNNRRREAVFLFYEEYETLRLCDYEKLNHLEASALMGVSRPTLTRIYMSAREKIALALVEGRKLIIEGGKVTLDSEWLSCNACGCYFNKKELAEEVQHCALCGSTDLEPIEIPENEEDNNEAQETERPSNRRRCGQGRCQKGGAGRRQGCRRKNEL